MMKQSEARLAILKEWTAWAQSKQIIGKGKGLDGLEFYNFLKIGRPGLLEFRCPGDKWQTIHAWLSSAGYVE